MPSVAGVSSTTPGTAPTTTTTHRPGHAATGGVGKASGTTTTVTITVPHSATTGPRTKTAAKNQHKISSSAVKTKARSRSVTKATSPRADHPAQAHHLASHHTSSKGTNQPKEQLARTTAATVPTGTSGGALAYTGVGPALVWWVTIGVGLVVAGTAGRRRAGLKGG